MKKQKTLTIALLFILIGNSLFAQPHPHHFDNREDKAAAVFNQLNLSPEQEAQVKAIQEKYLPQLKEIHEDARETHFKNIDKIREIRQSQKADLEKVLTEEQMTLLQEKMQHDRHFSHRKLRFEDHNAANEKHQVIRKEIHSYVLQNVLPVLQSQRTKLDRSILADDQAKIAALRNKVEPLKAARKELRNALRKDEQTTQQITQLRTLRETHQTDIEEAKALAEKYSTEIEGLKGEIEDDIQQWKTAIKDIADKHLDGADVPKGRLHRHLHHPHPFFHRMVSNVRFLLLDPNKDYTFEEWEESEQDIEERHISVFPNPTNQMNTIEFEVKKAGNVRIDLMGRNGAFIRTILNEYKTEGMHQLKVDITNLADQMYFYRISDTSGETTKEFLINR